MSSIETPVQERMEKIVEESREEINPVTSLTRVENLKSCESSSYSHTYAHRKKFLYILIALLWIFEFSLQQILEESRLLLMLVYEYTCICVCTSVHVFVCVRVYMYLCECVWMCTYLCVCKCVYIQCTCTCTCNHIK